MGTVYYTNHFIRDGFKGCTRGPFILIRPECRTDAGLLAHEKVHVRQFWRLPVIHSLAYMMSRKYRFRCEVEAYREQLKLYPDDRSLQFARFISTKYKIGCTDLQALAALRAK